MKQDLDFLLATIKRHHPDPCRYISAEAFEAEKKAAYEAIERSMTRREFGEMLSLLVASLQNSHTSLMCPPRLDVPQPPAAGDFHPIEIHWYHGKVILRSYYGKGSLPLGSTILTIQGEPAEQVLNRLARYTAVEGRPGGNSWRLETNDVLQEALKGEYGRIPLSLELRDLDNQLHQVRIEPITFKEARKNAISRYGCKVVDYRYLPEQKAGLLLIDSFDWQKVSLLNQVLSRAMDDLRAKGARCLIIDVRENPGGSAFGVDALLACLAGRFVPHQKGVGLGLHAISRALVPASHKRFEGQVYVLIGRRTGSAAVLFAAAVKYHRLGTLVGEETGDPTSLFGECQGFTLPNSGLAFGVATDWTEAIGTRNDGRGVLPDYEVFQEPRDTARRVDTVLQFVLNRIGQPPQTGPAQK